MPDVFANIAERTETTSSMYADINQLMENLRAIIGNGESAPSKTMEQLAVEQLKETGSNYTILDDDGYTVFIIDTSGGDVDLTFPTRADNIGRRILVINDGPNCVNCKPEGSDDINGYNADVVITEDKGWWDFTADSTEWKGVTDGWSSLHYVESTSGISLGTTVATWEDALTLSNLPKGKWLLSCSPGRYADVDEDTGYVSQIDFRLGLGVTSGNNEPDILYKRNGLVISADYARRIRFPVDISDVEYINTTVKNIYLKAQCYTEETPVVEFSFNCDATTPAFIRARRVA